ncbi:NAD(P)-binding protein [Aureobasidium subglaciale]|nr:NAD(P)-binding protein [Aureobasidium subglaciale]KAI5217620.1 NAD(P)-binding protein [Aureobasidium subglaciale]KAI5221221.1 NAD(P)-binding protein [Aureobasidium subglaciale]KAI5258914.1 NAD(P)-binding protein [Aureobasidium subglaciale]
MSKSLVFITGGTGYIGAEVIQQALETGYRVRLSVRKAEQATLIEKRYSGYTSDIETVVIPDISERKPFETALKDVDYIIHVASPIPGKGTDLQEDYIKPALNGTEAILYAALEFPKIKAVVITSSAVALLPLDTPMISDKVLKENSGEVLSAGVDLDASNENGHGMYRISKVLAHQATRDFLEKEKPAYKLVTTHPTLVIGESRIQSSPESIDMVNNMLWQTIQHGNPAFPSLWVDVKDVAAIHVGAINSSAPSGTEFICSGPEVSWNEIATFLKQEYPDLSKLEPNFEGPKTGAETGNAEKYLGLEWTPWKQTFKEAIDQQLSFQDKGAQ